MRGILNFCPAQSPTDGGDNESDGIQNRFDIDGVNCLRVRDGDIWVADTKCALLGQRHILPGASFPTFICLPRNESLALLNNGRTICHAMYLCALNQNQSLSRGKKHHVFTEGGKNIAAWAHSQEGLSKVSCPDLKR